jgi:hypothetical protein
MNKYRFKGEVITASSRKEAIKIFAKKTKVVAEVELDDDIYEKYGNDFLRDNSDDAVVYEMSQLDEIEGQLSTKEAIERGYDGHDYIGDISDKSKSFNPNEKYFSYDGYGCLVSIREVYRIDWLKENISERYFKRWLKDNDKEEYKESLRDDVEEQIKKVSSSGRMFGFEFPKLGYEDVSYNRDDDTLSCFTSSIDYDYDKSLDDNLNALYEEIQSDNPDAIEDEDE